MIIVKLMGGLGNQMFQYAAAYTLSKRLETNLLLDLSFLERIGDEENLTQRKFGLGDFELSATIADSEILHQFHKRRNVIESFKIHILNKKLFDNNIPIPKVYSYYKKSPFDPKLLLLSNNTLLEGHWQSENHFLEVDSYIRNEFQFKTVPDRGDSKLLINLRSQNSVSVHVRRGDYVHNQHINQVHGVLELEYYRKAFEIVSANVEDPVFYMFSDDLEWVKSTFHVFDKYHLNYVDQNQERTVSGDLRLMSNCKHNIIANSTYSWWGAWLNQNDNKIVIAPQKWYASERDTSHIIPDNWRRI